MENCNKGNFLRENGSTCVKVTAPPGGASTFSFGWTASGSAEKVRGKGKSLAFQKPSDIFGPEEPQKTLVVHTGVKICQPPGGISQITF